MITMTYDATVDALAVQLQSPGRGRRVRTIEVSPGVRLDYDDRGRLLALEVLDASVHVSPQVLARIPNGEEFLTLAEAAKESGLSSETLRGQIHKGRLHAIKRGHEWAVSATDLLNYLESRLPGGRPPGKRSTRQVPAKKRPHAARRMA
jgi:excisionase family DNA binding protein